ncbi:hypothetical protein [Ideonella sp. A 288]|uniref:hypothetical protein n=1 Tax=Ideonella sp. A 288 TaxID=1962181 RepID=UPI000B4BD20E|nr:hypothetical protein [Ideonella sp. A 288]
MPTIELWHWRVRDRVSGRRYVTRYPMSEANALDFDPCAERLPGSWELRPLWQAAHRRADHQRPMAAGGGVGPR